MLDIMTMKNPYDRDYKEKHFQLFKNYYSHVIGDKCQELPTISWTSKVKEDVTIDITDNHSISIPYPFKDLIQSIEESKQILELGDNWDDNGGISYNSNTLINAIEFIARCTVEIWENYYIIIDAPAIIPGADGNIDLLWKDQNYDLLIAIPPYPSNTASFYGDDFGQTKIEGTFNINNVNRGILLFLIEKHSNSFAD